MNPSVNPMEEPSAQRPPILRSRPRLDGLLVLLAGLGLATSAWALAKGRPVRGYLGLGLGAAAGLAFTGRLVGSRRDLETRQARLRALNRSLDEQIQGRTARLMQTIEDLESFNRMVTHDLKSPLTGLLLGMDNLQAHIGADRPDLLRHLDLLRAGADRMQQLLAGLQELALISGRLPVVERVDVSHHAHLVFLNLREKEPHRDVRWHIEPELTVLGDPNLIRIALENLLGNAWKYTLGRAPAEITVRRGDGAGTAIEIRDNGIGFEAAQAETLFRPFQRLHSDPRIPGHGIGLSIVKRVMGKHGGKVTAQGWPGQGALFRLDFTAD
ncbi:sensor histidine kinase [Mesoterricola silvestris]|uniref:sensor histidine kinase n=1 Tax=Mesoterricola silvestris TaxID=2927979 RepID=UPI00292DF8D9|nr:HAMP domain-containing sensor histidine kinase [Mesoterricola silvestris]